MKLVFLYPFIACVSLLSYCAYFSIYRNMDLGLKTNLLKVYTVHLYKLLLLFNIFTDVCMFSYHPKVQISKSRRLISVNLVVIYFYSNFIRDSSVSVLIHVRIRIFKHLWPSKDFFVPYKTFVRQAINVFCDSINLFRRNMFMRPNDVPVILVFYT